MSRPSRLLRDGVVMLALAVLLFAALEGATRLALRVRTGEWPRTLDAAFDDARRATAALYRRHPFLLVAPREGAADSRAERIVINSLGYRSPERPVRKPAGTARVLCAGGSTTYDTLAPSNALTWPGRLEAELGRPGRPVEVWNAGFPGWTTLENLIALASRDVALEPDVVVLYQGINDLQPIAHEPVDTQYAAFHAPMQLTSLGLNEPPLPWYRRLVLLAYARGVLFGTEAPSIRGLPERPGRRRTTISPEGIRVFERNVRSIIAVGRAHGARILLVTQPLRRRAAAWHQDRAVFEFWFPDLEPEAVFPAMEQVNDVIRALGASGDPFVADAARDIDWNDGDFLDPMHTTASGSAKLARYLAHPVAQLLPRD